MVSNTSGAANVLIDYRTDTDEMRFPAGNIRVVKLGFTFELKFIVCADANLYLGRSSSLACRILYFFSCNWTNPTFHGLNLVLATP